MRKLLPALARIPSWLGGKGSPYCPSQIKPSPEGVVLDPELAGPVHKRQGLSSKGKSAISPSISSLLCSCCPDAVAWTIIAVVVETFNRVFLGGNRTHITQKGSERIKPFLTNSDPSGVIHIRPATTFELVPDVVLLSKSPGKFSTSLSMFNPALFLQTAAALSFSSCKILSIHDNLLPTLAGAQPSPVPALLFSSFPNYCQSSKCSTSQLVSLSRHLFPLL